MTNITSGEAALSALNRQDDDTSSSMSFSSFKMGTTYFVKVLGTADLIQFFSYGIFGSVDSFVAEKPSKKSAKGYPVEDLTPWDKAWKYHKDLSKDFNDEHGKQASNFRAKERFALGFFDLDSGQPIIVDLSKTQAQLIHSIIVKYEKRLGRLAFELTKSGNPAQPTSTTVSLSPVLDLEEDLTPEQKKNFDAAPEKFDHELFNGLLYEANEEEMIDSLVKVGFPVNLIGLEQTYEKADLSPDKLEGGQDTISDDDMPF